MAGGLGAEAVAYQELAGRIRILIADGRIPVGTRLPAERELAVALGRSRERLHPQCPSTCPHQLAGGRPVRISLMPYGTPDAAREVRRCRRSDDRLRRLVLRDVRGAHPQVAGEVVPLLDHDPA